MKPIISETEVSYLLYEIAKRFPDNFLAGIICDKDGFLLAGPRKGSNFQAQMKESDLALLAIANKREIKKNSRFLGIRRDLSDTENIKLLLLLDKNNSKRMNKRFKELNSLISRQSLF